MQKNDRLLFIMLWIYNPRKKRPNISDIVEAFKDDELDISKRTIERDIQYLRNKGYIRYSIDLKGYDTVKNVDLNEVKIFNKIIQ